MKSKFILPLKSAKKRILKKLIKNKLIVFPVVNIFQASKLTKSKERKDKNELQASKANKSNKISKDSKETTESVLRVNETKECKRDILNYLKIRYCYV